MLIFSLKNISDRNRHFVVLIVVVGPTSASVASFEELQEVIDFLSGSSNSSLCLSQPMDGEKPRKVAIPKDCQSILVADDKGKVSPSDSGIGSTMSVRSSVSSIVGLHGGEGVSKFLKSKLNARNSINKSGVTKNDSNTPGNNPNGNKDQEEDKASIALQENVLLDANDAEVEHHNERGISNIEDDAAACSESEDEEARRHGLDGHTPTREGSTSSDNEASVQDVINDLKASPGFQKANLDMSQNCVADVFEDKIEQADDDKSVDER